MTHDLTVTFSEQAWNALQQHAVATGTAPDKVVATAVDQLLAKPASPLRKRKEDMTQEERDEARRELRACFGAVSMGTGADNVQIDADLAREYGSSHETN